MIASEIARESIKKHEGLRLEPYTDTVGKLSIGYGRNLDDRGISKDIAEAMLDEDMEIAERDCRTVYGEGFDDLSVERQAVLIEMCFQLGRSRFAGFAQMLAKSIGGDHVGAANEMLNSKWAQQVPARAKELASRYRLG